MGSFRRVSIIKVYSIFCTFFIIFLLSSSFQPEIYEEVSKLHKELKHSQKENLKLENQLKNRRNGAERNEYNLPVIYLITPTYSRFTQKADMTRLLHTLMHASNLHWIIVEDEDHKTTLITDFISRIPNAITVTHLNEKTPLFDKLAEDDPSWLKPRGVQQRNKAIKHMLDNFGNDKSGKVYFMDDDNTYDLRVFDEIRKIKDGTIGVWPVGIVGKLRYEGPVCENGIVKSWFTAWKPDRPFPLDMAGFAIPLQNFVTHPNAEFKQKVPRGYQESQILTGLGFTKENTVGLANDCRDVLVWHTRTEKPRMDAEDALIKKYGKASNLSIEV